MPVASHGEPLVEGSKGEPPPWSKEVLGFLVGPDSLISS
jgi:hypothetical protein